MAARLNTQQMLAEMRAEQREDHRELATKVDEGFKAIAAVAAAHELADTKQFNAIDKRLEVVENTRRSMRWLGATVVVALVGAAIDLVFVHLPKLFASISHP
jgi:hypothetical protein